MHSRLGVFNTNQVNLEGFAIPVEGLLSCLDQTWEAGLPMFVSHDMHRPIGWSSTVGLLILPELVALIGTVHVAESDEDMDRVVDAVRGYLNSRYSEVSPDDAQRLRDAIGVELSQETEIVRLDAVVAVEEGIAERIFPYLFSRESDKYALTDLAALKPIGPGVYEVEGLLLFAQRHFRRSMSTLNSLNAQFLSLLATCAQRSDLSVKIALDPDMVGLPGTWRPAVELQYWWGPKFKDDLPANTNDLTRHEADSTTRLFHGINRMEFWWHAQNDIKTLEAEEVLDNPSWGLSADDFACRYVHSMLDPVSGLPTHLDGAVRIYNTEMLLDRLDENIKTAGRKTDYVKLWRIDGPLDVPLWKALISHFYRDNRLVGEYLGGEGTVRPASERPEQESDRPLAAYVARCIEPSEGAAVLVSYEPPPEQDALSAVRIDSHYLYKGDGRKRPCIELSALDYIKLLYTRHAALTLPDGHVWMAFEDMDINLPLLIHSGPMAVANAEASVDALREFVSRLASHGPDRFVTAELAIDYVERRAKFSLAGFIGELSVLLPALKPFPPTIDGLANWCDQTHQALRKMFPAARYSPEHIELITPSGALYMRRKWAAVEPIPGGSASAQLAVRIKKDSHLSKAYSAGELGLAKLYEVRAAICSGCQQSYFECACTSLLNPGLAIQVTDCDLLGFMWASRPARETT